LLWGVPLRIAAG